MKLLTGLLMMVLLLGVSVPVDAQTCTFNVVNSGIHRLCV
jgi:hypothetical protein